MYVSKLWIYDIRTEFAILSINWIVDIANLIIDIKNWIYDMYKLIQYF